MPKTYSIHPGLQGFEFEHGESLWFNPANVQAVYIEAPYRLGFIFITLALKGGASQALRFTYKNGVPAGVNALIYALDAAGKVNAPAVLKTLEEANR